MATSTAPSRRREPLDLTWVDEWAANVRPYVFVRAEDRLLIKRPNQAQKLNREGVAILQALLDGVSIADVLDRVGRDPQRVHDVGLFLYEVKRSLDGTLAEGSHTHAVEVEPFDLGFSILPILSEVALTYRCNLRCTFCYAGCNCTANPAKAETEMTTAEVKGVLRRIRHEAQVPSVSFTGGEATIRPDLPDLVAYAHEIGLRVNLITNGTRITTELACRLADAGLASAQVSIEGVTAQTHDALTQIPGSFAKTVAAVGHLRHAGVHVHTHSTICRDNLDECLEMPQFVKEVLSGERFSMNLLVPTGTAMINPGLVVRYSEIGPYLRTILAESRRLGVEFMWYSPTPMCMFNPIAEGLGNRGCSACDGLLSVSADGDVLPCSAFNESIGNMLTDDVVELWRGERAQQHRDKFLAHPQCRECDLFAICNGACPLYWREVGFGELVERQGFAPAAEGHFER
jgi:radical SAM protein with 4Fe4S-binding SPASM domain